MNRERALAACGLALVVFVHVAVLWRAEGRGLDHDEGEHLRAAAWIRAGLTIYRDFNENHSPLLYRILAPLAPPPQASVAAMRSYVVRARWLSGAAGTVAALFVALTAMRLSRRGVAAIAAAVALLLVGWTSLRAFDDVRQEPYTLLLFWCGAWLLSVAQPATRRGALLAGFGIGAVSAVALWNPKWPAESLVMLGWFVWQTVTTARASKRLALLAIGVAAVPPLVAVAASLQVTTLRELVFFTYAYPAAMTRWFAARQAGTAASPLAFCSPWLLPWLVVPAALALLALRRSPPVLLALLLGAGSLLEIRFLYSYPKLWPQYFAMWACCAAVIYALLAAELVTRLPALTIPLTLALLIAFVAHELRFATQTADETHWALKQVLHDRLRPAEAAWVRPEEYPGGVPAGSYYWYAFDDQVPFSVDYARQPAARGYLPLLRDEDLPPCRILLAKRSGGATGVRFLDQRAVRHLPRSSRCMAELARTGAIVRVGATPLWEVR